jgi:MoxR-like ATPase
VPSPDAPVTPAPERAPNALTAEASATPSSLDSAATNGAAPAPSPSWVVTDPAARQAIERIAQTMQRIREAVASRIVGQDDVIEEALVAFIARGHVLLEGVPGTAKTLLIRTLAEVLGARFGRIQFTPDLMPSDITGVSVLQATTRQFEFHAGPIFTDLLLADEINRAPAKTQAALLEAMQERQVTTDGVARQLSDLFTVFATQNPVEYEGTYPLPEAQLDRFLVKIKVGYPNRDAELEMLHRQAAGFDPDRLTEHPITPLLDVAGCRALRAAVNTVKVAPEVQAYVTDIVRATREDTGLTLGGSPRAAVMLFRAARGAALLAGRDFVTPDDVKDYALAVLRHRVVVAPELEVEGRTADDVIGAVLGRVRAPQ